MSKRAWPFTPPGTTAANAVSAPPSTISPVIFKSLGIFSAVVILTPILIWFVLNRVKGCGGGKLHKPGHRPHYVRTWHGWVDVDKVAASAQKRAKITEKYRQKFVWKTTTADYSWIFWDPTGVKQREYENRRNHSVIRYLPRWMRSYGTGYLSPDERRIAPNTLSAAEEGKIAARSYSHSSEIRPLGFAFSPPQVWRRSDSSKLEDFPPKTSIVNPKPMMTCALPISDTEQSLGTVRRRKITSGKAQVWDANSQETRRATCTQLLAPRKMADAETDLGTENGTSAVHLQSTPIPDDVSDHFIRRSSSLPLFATLLSACNSGFRTALKAPVDIQPVYSRKTSKLYRLRPPQNSIAMRACCSTTQFCNSGDDLEASTNSNGRSSRQNLTQRLGFSTKHVALNPLKSLGNEYSGIAGRPGSPSTGWTINVAPRTASGSGLSGYEAAGSVEGASSYSCSARSSTSLFSCFTGENINVDLGKGLVQHEERIAAGKLGRLRVRIARRNFTSDSAFQGSYLPGEIALYAAIPPPSACPRSLLSNSSLGMLESWAAENWSFTRNPTVPLNLNFKVPTVRSSQQVKATSLDSISSITLRSPKQRSPPLKSTSTTVVDTKTRRTTMASKVSAFSKSAEGMTKTTGFLQSLDTSFLGDLDRRLKRLDYELSPGFRGPIQEGSSLSWLFDGAPSSAGVISRAPQSTIRNTSTNGRYLNPPAVRRRSHTAVLEKEKGANVATPRLRRRATAQGIIPRPSFTTKSEPDESAIDTAAWMLRRPPMRAICEDSADNSALLYTDGRGPSKTLSEWQKAASPLPPQQALNATAAISKLPGKRLNILGKLNERQNENDKDGKRPEDVDNDQRQRTSHSNSLVRERVNQNQLKMGALGLTLERTPAKRLFNNISTPINRERTALNYSSAPSSLNRTLMQ